MGPFKDPNLKLPFPSLEVLDLRKVKFAMLKTSKLFLREHAFALLSIAARLVNIPSLLFLYPDIFLNDSLIILFCLDLNIKSSDYKTFILID